MAVFDLMKLMKLKSLSLPPSKKVRFLGRQMSMSMLYTITVTPFLIGSIIAVAIPTIMRLLGYGWSMYPVAILLGLKAPQMAKGGLYDFVLHSHVWVAWLFMVLLVAQMATAAYRDKGIWVRLTHRILGKYVCPACMCWLLPTSTASRLLNNTYGRLERMVAVAITTFETVMIVVNFWFGYKEAVKRDIPKHKDLMMIMTLWALNPGWDRFNAVLLQLMIPTCWAGAVGLASTAWLANLEMGIYLFYVSERAGTRNQNYVRLNLAMFVVRGVALGVFTLAAFAMGLGSQCFV